MLKSIIKTIFFTFMATIIRLNIYDPDILLAYLTLEIYCDVRPIFNYFDLLDFYKNLKKKEKNERNIDIIEKEITNLENKSLEDLSYSIIKIIIGLSLFLSNFIFEYYDSNNE